MHSFLNQPGVDIFVWRQSGDAYVAQTGNQRARWRLLDGSGALVHVWQHMTPESGVLVANAISGRGGSAAQPLRVQ